MTAANAEAVKAEKQKIKEAVEQKEVGTIKNALSMGLTIEQTAKLAGVSVAIVESVKQRFSDK